jgi:hypothetical protein
MPNRQPMAATAAGPSAHARTAKTALAADLKVFRKNGQLLWVADLTQALSSPM